MYRKQTQRKHHYKVKNLDRKQQWRIKHKIPLPHRISKKKKKKKEM